MYDLVIRNGLLVDGSGSPPRTADVAIEGETVADIGAVVDRGRTELDARGLIVAPGFIDVHSHDDRAVIEQPELPFKLRQGVTTDIIGNCGWALVPRSPANDAHAPALFGPVKMEWTGFASYFGRLRDAAPACNVGVLIGHGAVRLAVMGTAARQPGSDELAEMSALVEAGMDAGALGLSSGLTYEPAVHASTAELVELARTAAAAGGLYASHIRDEGDHLLEAVGEAIQIGREGGCPVQISHHKAMGRRNWGKVDRSIAVIDRAVSAGMDVTTDVYPYAASSTILRAVAAQGVDDGEDAAAITIASTKAKAGLGGKSLATIASSWGLSAADTARRIVEADSGTIVIRHGMDEGDVRNALSHERAMIGSDGIPGAGKPHPRLYGTFARVLGHYVRDQRLFPIEEAVRRMTALPARKFKLARRGQLRREWAADIVCFEPETVSDRATYEEPRRYPAGIVHVVVNGSIVLRDGEQLPARPGRVLHLDG